MGLRDSRPWLPSYDDCARRVTREDYERIKQTFKRYAGNKEHISQLAFIRDIFADVPQRIAEELYLSFGGNQSKGISYRDIFCGLILLSKGTKEEKIKFLFGVIAGGRTAIATDDIRRLWSFCSSTPLPDVIYQEFTDPMGSSRFSKWILENRSISEFTKWLLIEGGFTIELSDNHYVPTFHETLADYTGLNKKDVSDLERRYYPLKGRSETSKLDLKYFVQITSPPLPKSLAIELFGKMDYNGAGYIDIVELSMSAAYLCRFHNNTRVRFLYSLFDKDKDGTLKQNDIRNMLQVLYKMQKENQLISEDNNIVELNINEETDQILRNYNKDYISEDDFVSWGTENGSLLEELLKILFQICHIVFGLRPQCMADERDVIKGYMVRSQREELKEGDTRYLLAYSWWYDWQRFVQYDPDSPRALYSNKLRKHSKVGKRRVKTNERYYTSYDDFEPYEVDAENEARKLNGPGSIDNRVLCVMEGRNKACSILTSEGGLLRHLPPPQENKDYVALPEAVWRALSTWYEGTLPLPRIAYRERVKDSIELELYPISISFYKHTSFPSKHAVSGQLGQGNLSVQAVFNSIVAYFQAPPTGPVSQNLNPPGVYNPIYRHHSYYGAFSKYTLMRQLHEFLINIFKVKAEELRLWDLSDDETPTLIEEDEKNFEELEIKNGQKILIEIRNKDNSWPEEVLQLMKKVQKQESDRGVNIQQAAVGGKVLKGCTGLNNLGNTCYMNSAFQCLSNTRSLTFYFLSGMYMKELNKSNPLGTKGVLAKRYGELVRELWSGENRAVAPIKFKWTLGRYEPQFNNFSQQDAQELLSVLLDRLHEDLNLVINKPYKELPDSDGRTDYEVSQENWDYHLKRNRSIVVQLFQGQLKSVVRCSQCHYTSVRFDPFTFLTLPLPADSSTNIDIVLIRLGGKVPEKYSVKVDIESTYNNVKNNVSEESNLPVDELIFTDVYGGTIRSVVSRNQKIKTILTGHLYAFQVPPPKEIDSVSPNSSPDTIRRLHTINNIKQASSPTQSNVTAIPNMYNNTTTNNNNNGDVENLKTDRTENTHYSKPGHLTNNETEEGFIMENMPSQEECPMNIQSRQPLDKFVPNTLNSDDSDCAYGPLVFAYHRKRIHTDAYFVAAQKQRPQVFGQPICIPCIHGSTNEQLYEAVWGNVKRLLSDIAPRVPTEEMATNDTDIETTTNNNNNNNNTNKYPFELKSVSKDGLTCSSCPWYTFCRGCIISPDGEPLFNALQYCAIDWEPAVLHLRYQYSEEKAIIDKTRPEAVPETPVDAMSIDLFQCLEAFSKEEELGGDEKWYCTKCKELQSATKKIEIFRLPPILIIHLKRFQFTNGRWIKSQVPVTFPFMDFQPLPHSDLEIHENKSKNLDKNSQKNVKNKSNQNDIVLDISEYETIEMANENSPQNSDKNRTNTDNKNNDETKNFDIEVKSKPKISIESGEMYITNPLFIPNPTDEPNPNNDSIVTSPNEVTAATDEASNREIVDHTSRTKTYDLFAMTTHYGYLGGGHYVAFAKNESDMNWYYYNDSSCKQTLEDRVSKEPPYLLFYKQQGELNMDKLEEELHDIPPETDSDDEGDTQRDQNLGGRPNFCRNM